MKNPANSNASAEAAPPTIRNMSFLLRQVWKRHQSRETAISVGKNDENGSKPAETVRQHAQHPLRRALRLPVRTLRVGVAAGERGEHAERAQPGGKPRRRG